MQTKNSFNVTLELMVAFRMEVFESTKFYEKLIGGLGSSACIRRRWGLYLARAIIEAI
jgi:hypothetical protein